MIVACTGIARPSRKTEKPVRASLPSPRTTPYAAISENATVTTTETTVMMTLLRK
ncbi:hypothetical protein GCM10020001_023860 [Nonomuraea salmonea]